MTSPFREASAAERLRSSRLVGSDVQDLASTPDGYTECFGGAKLLGYVQATDNKKRGNSVSRPVSDAR